MTKWLVVRQALSVLILPVTVVLVIPAWIARTSPSRLGVPGSPSAWAASVLGVVVLLAGLTLFLACLVRFGSEGKGTLAPWDPPTRLVVRGPYAYVRNPMISGVVLMLVAEAVLLRSPPHLAWAGLFFLINAVYIPLLEEPRLRRRFGPDYEEYANAVPGLIPRLRPWRQGEERSRREGPDRPSS